MPKIPLKIKESVIMGSQYRAWQPIDDQPYQFQMKNSDKVLFFFSNNIYFY